MSVSSIDNRISPLGGRFSDTRITAADLFQMVAWAALTVVFVVYAISENSLGALVLAALVLTQVWHAWSNVSSRRLNDVRDRLAPQQL
jgi:hypothetical protein